jgi:hypothetical protein
MLKQVPGVCVANFIDGVVENLEMLGKFVDHAGQFKL